MAGLKQEDEEVNCSMRLNKKRHVVVMWQIIDTFKKSVANHKIFKTVKSCREVEKARRHDEEYCDGSALPRHDPSKEKQMVLILSLPKPGGHVLSPDFGQIRRWAVSEDGLEGYTRGASLKRPCARNLGLIARVSVI
jgi:hypothetical protein